MEDQFSSEGSFSLSSLDGEVCYFCNQTQTPCECVQVPLDNSDDNWIGALEKFGSEWPNVERLWLEESRILGEDPGQQEQEESEQELLEPPGQREQESEQELQPAAAGENFYYGGKNYRPIVEDISSEEEDPEEKEEAREEEEVREEEESEEEREKHVFCMKAEIPCFSKARTVEKEGSDFGCISPCTSPPPQSPPIYSPDNSEFCASYSTLSDKLQQRKKTKAQKEKARREEKKKQAKKKEVILFRKRKFTRASKDSDNATPVFQIFSLKSQKEIVLKKQSALIATTDFCITPPNSNQELSGFKVVNICQIGWPGSRQWRVTEGLISPLYEGDLKINLYNPTDKLVKIQVGTALANLEICNFIST